jgi:uncharacterized protein
MLGERLRAMDEHECLERLEEGYVGRLALLLDDGPMIYPMNYRYAGGVVVLRSLEGSKLDALLDRPRVAFEVDGLDDEYHAGWSVVARGVAEMVSEEEAGDVLGSQRLRAWAGESAAYWVLLRPEVVTGRSVA